MSATELLVFYVYILHYFLFCSIRFIHGNYISLLLSFSLYLGTHECNERIPMLHSPSWLMKSKALARFRRVLFGGWYCPTIQEAALEPLKNGNEFPWSKLQGNPAVINVIWFAVFLEDGHNYDIWISLTYPPLPRYEWWTFLLPNCRTSAQLLFVCEVSVCSWYKACSTSWQSRVAKLNWIDAVSKVGVP